MATKTSQRVGIWIIAIVMTIGTLGAFFLPIMMNANASKESDAIQKAIAEAKKQHSPQPQTTKLPLDGYSAEPFDASGVTELKVEEITPGDGKEATADSTISANYFGWTSDGTIFDSTNKNGSTTPIEFPLSGVIKGWTEGLTGAKVGSVRKLTIPADKAYGEAGSPPLIGANQPLKFVVQITAVK